MDECMSPTAFDDLSFKLRSSYVISQGFEQTLKTILYPSSCDITKYAESSIKVHAVVLEILC